MKDTPPAGRYCNWRAGCQGNEKAGAVSTKGDVAEPTLPTVEITQPGRISGQFLSGFDTRSDTFDTRAQGQLGVSGVS
jgi:hypothetical protein